MTLLDPAPTPDAGRGRTATVLLVGALVIALVALGVAAWAWDRERDKWDRERDKNDDPGHAASIVRDVAEDAEAAARNAAVHMTTYDYRSIDEDFAWVDEVGTEQFREDFTVASEPVKEVVSETRTHAEGKVIESLATLDDATHATVVLFVDQELTDVTSPPVKLDRTRIKAGMVLRDGRWLVESLEAY